jgi:hypothetical protein
VLYRQRMKDRKRFIAKEDLPEPRLWRKDTRAIVGSILLAVAFAANMQLAERVDTATVGGIIPWTGTMFARIWFTSAGIFYGLTGALIVASFNPVIAILTSTGPLAPFHIVTNWTFSIPFTLIAHQIIKRNRGIHIVSFVLLVVSCALVSGMMLFGLWIYFFKFSPTLAATLYAWYVFMSLPGSILAFHFIRGVSRSGVIA